MASISKSKSNYSFIIGYLNAEAARGSWLAVLLGVQSMDWWGGGGGGGLGSRLKLPPNYRLHYTQGLVYVMCNTLQATANKNKNL